MQFSKLGRTPPLAAATSSSRRRRARSRTGVFRYRVPGARHIARSFGKLGLDGESAGGPDRFLPSAIVLDPPGQRLQLPGGPSAQLRRASEIAKSWKGFPKS